jgi:hypothetical protein
MITPVRSSSSCSLELTKPFELAGRAISNFIFCFFKKIKSESQEVTKQNTAFKISGVSLVESLIALNENLSDSTSVVVIANKINQHVNPLVKLIEMDSPNSILSEEVLVETYQMATSLKQFNPSGHLVWEKLCPQVKDLFHLLLPYNSPPTLSNSLPIEFGPMKKIPQETFHLRFSDKRIFEVNAIESGMGIERFTFPGRPQTVLTAISRAPSEVFNMMENYLKELPPALGEVFDIASLEAEINEYEGCPNLQNEILAKINHQKFVLKSVYMQMMLESLGVPVDRPIEVSSTGEWTITSHSSVRSLTSDSLSKRSSEEINQIGRGIRLFFELERKYGLTLIGEGLSENSSQNLFVLGEKTEVYQKFPPPTLIFFSNGVEERHACIKTMMVKSIPKELFNAIFKTPFAEPLDSEKKARIIRELVDKSLLNQDDILSSSNESIEILQALHHNVYLLENFEQTPWSSLKTAQHFLWYALFCKKLGNPTSLQASTDSVSNLITEIIQGIPNGFLPFANQITFRSKIEEIVSKELDHREQLTKHVLILLYQNFILDPDCSFEQILEKIIETVNKKILIGTGQNLFIPKLKEQKLTSTGAQYIYEEKSQELEPYIYHTVWIPTLDSINEALFPAFRPSTVEESIMLLRGGYYSSRDEALSKNLREKLFEIVHSHMLMKEQSRTIAILKNRIKLRHSQTAVMKSIRYNRTAITLHLQ